MAKSIKPGSVAGLSLTQLVELTRFVKSLADEHRLRILALLHEQGEMNVSAIGDHLGQSQPAVSHHLHQLKEAGLIAFRRDGKFNFYSLSDVGVLRLAETLFPGQPRPTIRLGSLTITLDKPKLS